MVFSPAVIAWGPTGHRIVGALAEQHLQPAAREKVRVILQGYKLQDVGTWADDIKSETTSFYRSFYNWHAMEIEDPDTWQTTAVDTNVWPKNLHMALYYCIDQLQRQPEQARLQKEVLLKMLVHLVADAHQPLHVGNGTDRGANYCYVRWFGTKYATKLHQVWDSKLIEFTRLSYTEYTDYLNHVSAEDITKWQHDPIDTWLLESRRLHADIYPSYGSYSPESYCSVDGKPVPFKQMPTISFRYIYANRPVLEQRLQQAGIRLAGVLNRLWG